MIVIGLGHKKRRGKDTLVEFLKEARGKSVKIKRYAFADALKQEVTQAIQNIVLDIDGGKPYTNAENMFMKMRRKVGKKPLLYVDNISYAVQVLCDWAGVPYEQDAPKDDPLCPYGKQRYLLQWWGSEYRRASDPDYWVRKLEDTLVKERSYVDVGMITDMRFPNEFEMVKKLGGITVRLDRVGYTDVDNHISETALDGAPFDYVVKAGSLVELKANGLSLFDQVVMERLK